MSRRYFSFVIALIGNILLVNSINLYAFELICSGRQMLRRLFPSKENPSITFDSSIIASPLIDLSQGKRLLIVPASNGQIAALDSETGAIVWQFPDPSNIEAVQTFRNHTSLPVITNMDKNGGATILVLDIGQKRMIYGVHIKDGQPIVKQELKGTGLQDSFPLIYNDNLYLASIMPGTSNAMIEAYHYRYN